jgi:hypothetical protein
MATLADAEALAHELNAQAKQHPRVSMLLVPEAKLEQDELVIAFYWLDREKSDAADTVIRFADYASQPAEQAAKQILDQLSQS